MSERQVVNADAAPEAAGPYSHAMRHGGVLYCAGQVPIDPETGELIEGGPGEQTTRCLRTSRRSARRRGRASGGH